MSKPSGPRIIVVIHHIDDATTLQNAEIAVAAGAHGVALIQMEGKDHQLEMPAKVIRARYPDLFMVVNRLSTHPADGVRADFELGMDGTWIDNPGLSSKEETPLAAQIDAALSDVRGQKRDYVLFGSVAFKTQAPDPDPARAAELAVKRGWVATTSGPGTGIAPDIAKLKTMRAGAWEGELAVASGVSPDNAAEIAPLVDWILVASGITPDFYHLDAGLTRKLVDVCAASVETAAA